MPALAALTDHAARPRHTVITAPIDRVDMAQAVQRMSDWAAAHESRYVCICNVHSVVTAHRDANFHRAVAQADMATPDGAPVAWMMARTSGISQPRVSGPDLMLAYCQAAAQRNEGIYLLGSTEQTLALLQDKLLAAYPGLRIAGSWSPPFRPLTPAEDAEIVGRINASGAGTVWVSLGCPKQELWMAAHRGKVQAVMVGVGAAFDFHAGIVRRAPAWMRDHGLEWLHRLLSEPRRLWRRYLTTNLHFMVAAAAQLLGMRVKAHDAAQPPAPPPR